MPSHDVFLQNVCVAAKEQSCTWSKKRHGVGQMSSPLGPLPKQELPPALKGPDDPRGFSSQHGSFCPFLSLLPSISLASFSPLERRGNP